MENFWTSNKPIKGLRHFVLVNETREQGNIIFLMVSVLDSEINLKTSYDDLINSGNWYKGWIKLPKIESEGTSLDKANITELYEDKSGVIWVSTRNRGVHKIVKTRKFFKSGKSTPNSK